jgi:hypothetical protein
MPGFENKKENLDPIGIKKTQMLILHFSHKKAISRLNGTDLIIPPELVHPKLNTTIHHTQ